MEYHSALTMSKLPIHTTTWMNLKGIMPSGRSHSQKVVCLHLSNILEKAKTVAMKDRSVIARGEGWREGVIQSYTTRECFEGDETALCPRGGVLWSYTCVKMHGTVWQENKISCGLIWKQNAILTNFPSWPLPCPPDLPGFPSPHQHTVFLPGMLNLLLANPLL